MGEAGTDITGNTTTTLLHWHIGRHTHRDCGASFARLHDPKQRVNACGLRQQSCVLITVSSVLHEGGKEEVMHERGEGGTQRRLLSACTPTKKRREKQDIHPTRRNMAEYSQHRYKMVRKLTRKITPGVSSSHTVTSVSEASGPWEASLR